MTLDADFVSTLAIGKHTIAIVSRNDTASTTFTVNAKVIADNNNPIETEDNSQKALWIAVLFVSSGGLLYSKKNIMNNFII